MAKYEVAAAVIATLVFNWNTCMKPTNWAWPTKSAIWRWTIPVCVILGVCWGLDQHHDRHCPLKNLPSILSALPFNEVSDKADIELVCEMDEPWSYVGKKSPQRWLWYAWLPPLKRVFAYALGSRGDDTLKYCWQGQGL
jgi:hypothetical protein